MGETWKWMSHLATCLHYWSVPVGEEVGKSRSYFLRSRIKKLEEGGKSIMLLQPNILLYLLSTDHTWVLFLAILHGMQESFLTRD